MSKLKKEAIDELMKLINEVRKEQSLMIEFGINYFSDRDLWEATDFNHETGILEWDKEVLEKMNGMKDGNYFIVGGCITTGGEHEYKNKWIVAPKKLAEVQGEIVEEHLYSVIQSMSPLKYFQIEFCNPYGLYNNCGWEQFMGIKATIKCSALENNTDKLIQQIRNEEDVILELSASPLYDNPKSNFHKDSGLVPNGEFAYMLEFFSDLIGYDEETYQGAFGLNSRYIKDAMKLITKVENRAKEIEEKYADKGVKVTVNGMNDGCEYGMAVYVWIPYQ